jgi:hypothetical protein
MSTYNGWKNYQTWAAHLWLANEEDSYRYWTAQAGRTSASDLASRLEIAHEESMPVLSGLYGDLLTSSFADIDWREIAASLIEDAAEEEEEESGPPYDAATATGMYDAL